MRGLFPDPSNSASSSAPDWQGHTKTIADLISFAAAPTFGAMAAAGFLFGGEIGAIVCLGANPASSIDAMSLMYLLMGIFHLPPWLRLFNRGKSGAY